MFAFIFYLALLIGAIETEHLGGIGLLQEEDLLQGKQILMKFILDPITLLYLLRLFQ